MSVIVHDIWLNKTENNVIIKGRVIDPMYGADTLGVDAVNIFLAQPLKNKLTRIRKLTSSHLRRSKDSHQDKFPFRNGDFIVDVHFPQETDYILLISGLSRSNTILERCFFRSKSNIVYTTYRHNYFPNNN